MASGSRRWCIAGSGGRDLVALVIVLQRMLRESGSIEAFFRDGDDPSSAHIGPALDAFSTRALATDLRAAYGRRRPPALGVAYFFPRPSAGSACKRPESLSSVDGQN
jgi:hypothetical protein